MASDVSALRYGRAVLPGLLAATRLIGLALLAGWLTAHAGAVTVRTPAEFRAAVDGAQPGTCILLAGGVYGGGFHFSNLRGERDRPIMIAAADRRDPPVFRDANLGLHLTNPAYVELRDLVFTRLAHNGLNIDDGGATSQPESAHHVTLRGLRISDIGHRAKIRSRVRRSAFPSAQFMHNVTRS